MKRRLPKSVRKYLRRKKACIRREVFDVEEQERLIQELYKKFLNPNSSKKQSLKN